QGRLGHEPPKEQLQQQLVARHFVARRLLEPLAQPLTPRLEQRVHLAIGPAGLALDVRFDQSCLLELLERRIDLTVALAPEMTDRLLDRLLEVVARLVLEVEQAE